MCKTEAHAYVCTQETVQTSDCVGRVSENLKQRVGSQNSKHCSPSKRGGEQTRIVGLN